MSYRVLLVCMGNICRSPTAEGVLRKYLQNNMLAEFVEVDSAGTHGYHVGEAPDSRTQRAAAARGYNLSQLRARKVAAQDIEYFDLRRMAPPEAHKRLRLFMEYARNFEDDEVPDPYYGLGHGFDLVLDMIEDGAQGLVDELRQRFGRTCED
jgi:protein-tyrosine phosphatase